jgi:hypothetical protein
MTLASLTRWKAFLIHLAISALIATAVVVLVVAVWYPGPYFAAMGGEILLRLLIGVDVVIGPLVTLIIFDPAKPRLKYDLAIIAALQLAALAYGSYVMFEARPVYTVFVKDRFEIVPANRVDPESLGRAAPEFRTLRLSGPRVVAALMPANSAEQAQIAFAASLGGPDVAELPHLYVPYADAAPKIAAVARPLVALSRLGREEADLVSGIVATRGGGRSMGFVPVKARNHDLSAIVDRATGELVGFLPIHPW